MTGDPYVYDGDGSILGDWEHGVWERMPPPPSVHSAEYRAFIVDRISSLAGARRSLISVGCGNANIEVDLQRVGFDVLATDNSGCALDIAERKGLAVARLDVWSPPIGFKCFDVVYADGVAGHILARAGGTQSLTDTLRRLSNDDGLIVLSNDLADGAETSFAVTGHAAAAFFRGPCGEVARRLKDEIEPWTLIESELFPYERPNRGKRTRELIVFARQSRH